MGYVASKKVKHYNILLNLTEIVTMVMKYYYLFFQNIFIECYHFHLFLSRPRPISLVVEPIPRLLLLLPLASVDLRGRNDGLLLWQQQRRVRPAADAFEASDAVEMMPFDRKGLW